MAIVTLADPCACAGFVSGVTPKTAFHLGELVQALAITRDHPWSQTFLENLDRKKLIEFADEWPIEEPAWIFAKFCAAIVWIDESLAQDMAEQFIPIAQLLLREDPVSAFRDLDDIVWHVLRVFDPLGVYVGKLAPGKRQLKIAAKML